MDILQFVTTFLVILRNSTFDSAELHANLFVDVYDDTGQEQNCTNLSLEVLPRDKEVRRKGWEACPQNQLQDLEYAIRATIFTLQV